MDEVSIDGSTLQEIIDFYSSDIPDTYHLQQKLCLNKNLLSFSLHKMAIQEDILSDPEIRTRLRNCMEHGRLSVLKLNRMLEITH